MCVCAHQFRFRNAGSMKIVLRKEILDNENKSKHQGNKQKKTPPPLNQPTPNKPAAKLALMFIYDVVVGPRWNIERIH